MIKYRYPEEKTVALIFAKELNNNSAKEIIERGKITSREEAILLSKFFWNMVSLSSTKKVNLPLDGGSEYWTEKLYNSFGGYIHKIGFDAEWDEEVDNA